MSWVSVKNLKVGYDEHIALEDVTFKVQAPFFTTIIGPNGAGKTTLLKSLLGMVRKVKGEVRVFGIDPFERPNDVRDMVGYVPQKERIYAPVPIRVEQVIMMGFMLHRPFPRVHMRKDREEVEWALEKVGLQGFGKRAFHELSGGQQQRVVIARAIVRRPSLLLLDEPFSGVDARAQFSIVELLYGFKKERISVMMVTHDVNVVSRVSDNIVVLNRRLLAFGTPNEVLSDRGVLEQVYGPAIKIFHGTPCPSVILGDHHA